MEDNFNNGMPDTAESTPTTGTGYTDTSASTPSDMGTGYTDYSSAYTPESSGEEKSTLSTVALVCGIVGLVLGCCCCIGVAPDIAAIVTGILAKKKNEPKSGFALAGIILGAVGIVIYLITFIINQVEGTGDKLAQSFMDGFNSYNSGAFLMFF